MALPRIIPVLLLKGRGLVKTVKFKDPVYVGDPINAVKIFNEKEVDELIILDIGATPGASEPQYDYLREIVSECFSPLGYGGGITTIAQIRKLIQSGLEKVILNTVCVTQPDLVKQAADSFGSSTIVASMDIKKNLLGRYTVYSHGGRKNTGLDPMKHAVHLQQRGAGELFVNMIDLDGTMKGYDHAMLKKITAAVDIPVVACGGAANLDDLFTAIHVSGASGAAAGSLFVFHGRHKAVLITYPEYEVIQKGLRK
ncbi:MAG TPA: AglZ/HisF2 family acetamidino modification protein [Ohtaekwangia sp.]|nr:AglZ/HisF2 family acetamidino modification protein [Ohtaekwangia sp.]